MIGLTDAYDDEVAMLDSHELTRAEALDVALGQIERQFGKRRDPIVEEEVDARMAEIYAADPMPPPEVDDPPRMTREELADYRRALRDEGDEPVQDEAEIAKRMPRVRWLERMSRELRRIRDEAETRIAQRETLRTSRARRMPGQAPRRSRPRQRTTRRRSAAARGSPGRPGSGDDDPEPPHDDDVVEPDLDGRRAA